MEETFFLMPVQRIVGGVEIEGDLRRRGRMGIEKQIDKCISSDLIRQS